MGPQKGWRDIPKSSLWDPKRGWKESLNPVYGTPKGDGGTSLNPSLSLVSSSHMYKMHTYTKPPPPLSYKKTHSPRLSHGRHVVPTSVHPPDIRRSPGADVDAAVDDERLPGRHGDGPPGGELHVAVVGVGGRVPAPPTP